MTFLSQRLDAEKFLAESFKAENATLQKDKDEANKRADWATAEMLRLQDEAKAEKDELADLQEVLRSMGMIDGRKDGPEREYDQPELSPRQRRTHRKDNVGGGR